MPLAYIALGSNVGDRIGQMRQSLKWLEGNGGINVRRASPVYQNRAVGMGEGAGDFLNAVVEVSSTLEPLELLEACLEVERQLGRTRSKEGWGPRTIDLDLLVYEGVTLREERLTLPHPRIGERDFVAVPLADLAPEICINAQTLRQLVEKLPEDELMLYPETL